MPDAPLWMGTGAQERHGQVGAGGVVEVCTRLSTYRYSTRVARVQFPAKEILLHLLHLLFVPASFAR